MRCAQCGGENPSGFAFCGGCGAPLLSICARCGFQTQPSFAFCGKCGAPLPVAAAILTPEERDHLRTYLPSQLFDTLPFDVRTWPTPLLEQCIAHLSALIETIYTLLPSYLLEDLVRDPAPGRASGRFVQ